MAGPEPTAATPPQRMIALHADDLGMNRAVSDGIFQGFEQGLLHQHVVVEQRPRRRKGFELLDELESRRAAGRFGIHGPATAVARPPYGLRPGYPSQPDAGATPDRLTLIRPSCWTPAAVFRDFGLFRRLARRGALVAAAIEEELTCQTESMIDRGHPPTHLNGHQYIEMLPVVSRVLDSLLQRTRIRVVRVAWEPSWWRSFLWPGIGTCQWLLGGLKKLHAAGIRRRMVEKGRVFRRRLLWHHDRRYDIAADYPARSWRQCPDFTLPKSACTPPSDPRQRRTRATAGTIR